MKKVNLVIGILLLSLNVFSQGWIGNSATNSLNPVNASLGLTPMSIGIGTNTRQSNCIPQQALDFKELRKVIV